MNPSDRRVLVLEIQLERLSEGFTPFGVCMGVKDIISPHEYYDGKFHYENSHGICCKCIEERYKIKCIK